MSEKFNVIRFNSFFFAFLVIITIHDIIKCEKLRTNFNRKKIKFKKKFYFNFNLDLDFKKQTHKLFGNRLAITYADSMIFISSTFAFQRKKIMVALKNWWHPNDVPKRRIPFFRDTLMLFIFHGILIPLSSFIIMKRFL